MMPFIGVRISWLMLARNSLLAHFRERRRLPGATRVFLGALAIGDVREGGDEPAARRRVAPDLEDGAVRAQPLEPVRKRLKGGRDALLHDLDVARPVQPARDIVAGEVGIGGSELEDVLGKLEEIDETLVPGEQAQVAVDREEALVDVLEGGAEDGGPVGKFKSRFRWCRTRSRSVAMRLKASTVGAISTNLVGGKRTEKSPRPNRAALSARARTGWRPRFRIT